ncbi:hypothetical protein SDC9_151120 [bioreactor metagenome]|uniref:Uncharacterized protein n=1 Tax=bioreactor metagenome TaxID=1076179 RepID=A0A645EPE6_9ZZZZ
MQICLHLADLLGEGGRLPRMLDAVAEEVRKVFNKQAGFFRAFHHGKLRACVERVVEKMRVDLGLQKDQLALF